MCVCVCVCVLLCWLSVFCALSVLIDIYIERGGERDLGAMCLCGIMLFTTGVGVSVRMTVYIGVMHHCDGCFMWTSV